MPRCFRGTPSTSVSIFHPKVIGRALYKARFHMESHPPPAAKEAVRQKGTRSNGEDAWETKKNSAGGPSCSKTPAAGSGGPLQGTPALGVRRGFILCAIVQPSVPARCLHFRFSRNLRRCCSSSVIQRSKRRPSSSWFTDRPQGNGA